MTSAPPSYASTAPADGPVQQQVQYVDQNGNPIQVVQQQPQQQVQYVHQNGNPIQVVQAQAATPQTTIVVQQQPAVVQPPRWGHASCMVCSYINQCNRDTMAIE